MAAARAAPECGLMMNNYKRLEMFWVSFERIASNVEGQEEKCAFIEMEGPAIHS